MRGYFGIGIYCPKTETNMGTLWRSAYLLGASFIFTIGRRYQRQPSDTVKAYKHVPLWNFLTFEEFKEKIPLAAQLVCIEIDEKARDLKDAHHPETAVYLLGAEDHGIPQAILKGNQTIQIPVARNVCSLNVAVSGSIVMYDRLIKNL